MAKGAIPGVGMVAEGATLEDATAEVPDEVPKSQWSLRPRPTLTNEAPKNNKVK